MFATRVEVLELFICLIGDLGQVVNVDVFCIDFFFPTISLPFDTKHVSLIAAFFLFFIHRTFLR